jgi:hypothetical protein
MPFRAGKASAAGVDGSPAPLCAAVKACQPRGFLSGVAGPRKPAIVLIDRTLCFEAGSFQGNRLDVSFKFQRAMQCSGPAPWGNTGMPRAEAFHLNLEGTVTDPHVAFPEHHGAHSRDATQGYHSRRCCTLL